MAIYMLAKGQKQGAIAGSVNSAGFTNQILVKSVQFGMGWPVAASTGLVTGKQVAKPIVITKLLDKATPLLLTACINNENMTTVTISYVFEGASHTALVTVLLTNAMIQEYGHTAQDSGGTVETVTFNYQKVEFTWTDGGIAAAWDLTA
jgi:type VI secretion system secreted protein Hcp